MNITLKEIPTDLHQKLKKRAEANGRSLNKELILMLEQMVNPQQFSPNDLLSEIRRNREKMPFVLDNESLNELIQEGRE